MNIMDNDLISKLLSAYLGRFQKAENPTSDPHVLSDIFANEGRLRRLWEQSRVVSSTPGYVETVSMTQK